MMKWLMDRPFRSSAGLTFGGSADTQHIVKNLEMELLRGHPRFSPE